MKTYKPQELADLLNLSAATLRKWASEEYGEFLSPSGQGGGGARRSFAEHDARVLAWIALMKQQNTPPKDILFTLKASAEGNWKTLPDVPVATIEGSPIEVMPREAVMEKLAAAKAEYEGQLALIRKERDQLQDQLTEKQRELERKQTDLEIARREAAETLAAQQKDAAATISTLQQRITELSTKEAELRGRMEQYSIGGRRTSAATLIVAALVVGALFTLAIIVLASLLHIPR